MKTQRIYIVFILLFIPSFTLAQTALQWRTFLADNSTWFISPSGVLIFSSASQSIRPATVDPVRKVNLVTDAVEYDGYIFISTDAGLYKVDMNSQSSERIPFPDDQIIQGKIAIDMDYLWLTSAGTLYKFDRLGGEWQSYKIPGDNQQSIGVFSNGDEVICIEQTTVYRFTVSTEKWNYTGLEKNISGSAAFMAGQNVLNVIDRNLIRRYIPASFSWETTVAANMPRDILDEDTVMYFVDGSEVMKLTSATNIVRPLDVPQTGVIYALSKISDTLLIAAEKRITKYSIKSGSMDFVEYNPDLDVSSIEKIMYRDNFIVVMYKSVVALYDNTNRVWQTTPRSGLKQDIKKVTWNDNGLTARYTPGVQSLLTGSFEDNFSLKFKGYEYDTSMTWNRESKVFDSKIDTVAVMGYSPPTVPLMNLTLKTSDSHDRSMEIFFNNTSLSTVPSKGIYYHGNRDDRFNNMRIGTASSDQISSTTLPAAQIEGGSALFESKERVEGRDRKVLRVAAGAGYITSRTEWKTFPFRSDGIYYLIDKKSRAGDTLGEVTDGVITDDTLGESDTSTADNSDTLRIVPGSVKVWVDGEILDSSDYIFYNPTAKLQIAPDAPVDPVSSITIQYKVQTISDNGINQVEFIPEHNFGLLYFGAVSLAPLDWISARVGFMGIGKSDTVFTPLNLRKPSPIVNVSTPIEIRKDIPNLLLKINPEFSYNMNTGARAGSAALQSRIGKRTGITMNAMFADSDFTTTDTLSYGYGAIRDQYDLNLSHDITDQIPVSYYQHRRRAEKGIESRYSAQTGVHFPGYPFLDLNASRTTIDHHTIADSLKTAFDSLFDTKDKVRMRLYETSAKILENLTRMRKISYDISHSEYRTESKSEGWTYGRMSTAEITLTPVQPVTVTGNLLYRGGIDVAGMPASTVRPGLEVQTVDAPKGVDIGASYYLNYGKYTTADTSTDSIHRSMNVIIKPGMWFSSLRWFSPHASVSNDIGCSFDYARPRIIDLVSGSKNVQQSSMQESFGVNIFPTDQILIRNDNEFSQVDSNDFFKTTNDFQLWHGKNYWQAIWNFSTQNQLHNGTLNYDRVWTSWLRTAQGLVGDYMTDSTGKKLEGGPALKINLNFQKLWVVKILSNSHDFKMIWTRKDGINNRIPRIAYSFNLSVVILPNIQLNNFETFTYEENLLSEFQSRFSLVMNF